MLCIATLALSLHYCAKKATPQTLDGDELLDPNRLIEIKIELPGEDWDQLCRQSRNPATAFSGIPSENPYTYFEADIWIDDVKIESVGIRKKGFFGSADTQRPSLKVKFDEFTEQDPVEGLSRLTLNNNKQDQTQVSQYLTYRLYRRAGNPAPRSNWAHVTVNGESLGVYSHVESIKTPFLKRVFQDTTGNLYEGTLTDFHPKSLTSIEVKTNEDENNLSDVTRLAEVLAADGELDLKELDQLLDLDAFYRHWALEGLIGFWDGYSSNQNNYYVYFRPSDGRGQFIPWGADWVFTNGGPFARGGFGGASRGPSFIYAQGIITNRLYGAEGGAERYQATMRQILRGAWDEETMLAEIDRVEKLVTPYLHSSQSRTPQAMDEMREFIRGRRAAVERALENWRPDIPAEPRKPAYIVDVGKAKGSFATSFSGSGSNDAPQSKVDLVVELDGKRIEFEDLAVSVQRQAFRGFGGPGGGRPGRGFGGGRGPGAGAANAPPAPVSVVFTGERSNGEPVTLSFAIDPTLFEAEPNESIRVTGSYREGRGGGGFGFGGFGGGPSRSVIGTLTLAKAGLELGDEVAGRIDVRIVETHGGFFAQRRPGRRGPRR